MLVTGRIGMVTEPLTRATWRLENESMASGPERRNMIAGWEVGEQVVRREIRSRVEGRVWVIEGGETRRSCKVAGGKVVSADAAGLVKRVGVRGMVRSAAWGDVSGG